MTKKKILFSIITFISVLAFMLGISLALSPNGNLFAKLFGNNETIIKEFYEYGETFAVPEKTIDGASSTTSLLTYPDGTQSAEKEVKLNQAGKYTLTYSAIVNNELKSDEYSFKVKYPSVTGFDNSTVYYGTSPYGDAGDTPGLFVALDSRDTITFSQIIDLNGSTKETFFAELFPTPSTEGSSDCEQFWITLTDIENSENYLTIRMNLYTEGTKQTMTLAARSNSQTEVIGLEESSGFIHVGNPWGAYPGVEMNGTAHGVWERDGAINTLKLSYEESTKIVWSHNKWGMPTKIVDLDDPTFVGEALWNGFDSGKVRMSFYARGYISDKANFVFKNVLGADFTTGGTDDTTAPILTVEQPSLAAAIGGEYTLPKYSVKDNLSPIAKEEVKVVKEGTNILIKDGKFKTDSAGLYSVTYTVYDTFGNKTEETISIEANTAPQVTISEVTLKNSYNRGEKVLLPTVSVSGGRGNNVLNIYATVNGEKELLDGNKFIPMESGAYTITYEGVGQVGQKAVKEYSVSVINSVTPVFRDEPMVPDYFISAFTYRDPVVYGYDYSSGSEKKIPATLTVTDAFGDHIVESGGRFTPYIINNLEEITLTWKVGDSSISRKAKGIFSKSSDGILIENYFIGNASVSKGDGYMEFTANSKNDEWTFINTLIADSFSLELTAIPSNSDFDAIEIVLVDAEDERVSFTATLAQANDYRSIAKIGKREALLSTGFHQYSTSNNFVLKYSEGLFYIGSAKIPVDRTDSGEVFTNFPSETVKVTVKFVNAEVGAKYRVTNLCGQPLGELYSDRIKPLVKVLGNYGGSSEVGATIIIPKMIAKDVINPSVITYVTAKDEKGNFVTADDGTVLNKATTSKEYTFKPTSYGQYQIEYVASDTLSQRENKVPFIIKIFDAEAPIVSFMTEPVSTIKVGENIVIPNIKATDNITSEENLIISYCIVSATGKVFHLPEGSNSMQAMHVGTYQIRVLVYDEAGNIAMLCNDVTVTE